MKKIKFPCGIESGVRVSLRLLGCILSSQPKVYKDFIQTFSNFFDEKKNATRVYEFPFKLSLETGKSSDPMGKFLCNLIKVCSKHT